MTVNHGKFKYFQHLTNLSAVGWVRIGLWGRSMGAVTAIMYGSRDPSVRGPTFSLFGSSVNIEGGAIPLDPATPVGGITPPSAATCWIDPRCFSFVGSNSTALYRQRGPAGFQTSPFIDSAIPNSASATGGGFAFRKLGTGQAEVTDMVKIMRAILSQYCPQNNPAASPACTKEGESAAFWSALSPRGRHKNNSKDNSKPLFSRV